jgi:acyl-CoA synthetase (AMP-forming)/AMP-acid ligase II
MNLAKTQNDTPTTLPRALAHAARVFGNRMAVVDGSVTLSFSALERASMQAGAAFLRAGVGRGDRVAIWAPNCWQWIVACLGAQIAGAAVVPLNTRLKADEAAYILARSKACCLITAGTFLGIDHAALLDRAAVPNLRLMLRFDLDWNDFVASGQDSAAARAAAEAVLPDQPSDILFTSGTTGRPKGVVATHGQTVRVFQVWADRVGLTAADRYLIVNPFFHTFGYKAGWLACLLTGAGAYPMRRLDVADVARLTAAAQITVLPGPPTLFVSLLQDAALLAVQWRPLDSLRVAVTGAAVVAPDLIERMRTDLRIPVVLTGYGLTESCGVVTMSQSDDDAQTVAHTCGRPIPGVDVRIAGASGGAAPLGESGEVLVRGYNVMAGYFEDEAATASAIDRDGWLHTGDVGCLDARGYLRITDRLKDMYICGGFNCYPAEIERALASHPDVARVAVIGSPDDRLGEVGAAFVVRRPESGLTAESLIDWARREMANYKAPRHVRFVDELPTNASGKVMKSELRLFMQNDSNGV